MCCYTLYTYTGKMYPFLADGCEQMQLEDPRGYHIAHSFVKK